MGIGGIIRQYLTMKCGNVYKYVYQCGYHRSRHMTERKENTRTIDSRLFKQCAI